MLRQFVHGSLAIGEIVVHGLCGEPHCRWFLVLTGSVMALISAVGLARRISEALVCVEPARERH
jgi:hypothetical protein